MVKSIVIRGAPRLRPWGFLAVVAALATVAAISAPRAGAAVMNCQQQGYCYWGYNYVGVSVNRVVVGNWNYWYDQYLDKKSGDWIAHGFEPQGGGSCVRQEYGTTSWYGYPSQLGCGGYIRPYTEWVSGNTSYLYFDDIT